MNALIEFLTILPEEINNKRLKLGQNRRDHLKNLFSNSSGYIIEFLEASLKNELSASANSYDSLQIKLRLIYKCFASWIEEKLIDPSSIVDSQLFIHLFQFLVSQILYF
jgi:hypothetical protein